MRSVIITRSVHALTVAAAAMLVSSALAAAPANAKAIEAADPVVAPQASAQPTQVAMISAREARRARRETLRAIRQQCRSDYPGRENRQERRHCIREQIQALRSEVRAMRHDCRNGATSRAARAECRQNIREFWVNGNGGNGGD